MAFYLLVQSQILDNYDFSFLTLDEDISTVQVNHVLDLYMVL
jgi:hypothetical protein